LKFENSFLFAKEIDRMQKEIRQKFSKN